MSGGFRSPFFWLGPDSSSINKTLNCNTGSYSVSGSNISFSRDYVIVSLTGSYSLSGINGQLARGLVFGGATGIYALTGTSSSFSRNYASVAAIGSYAASGSSAEFVRELMLAGSNGIYSLSGSNGSLTKLYIVLSEAGSYIVDGTGISPGVKEFIALNGSYISDGCTIVPLKDSAIAASSGNYEIIGIGTLNTYRYPYYEKVLLESKVYVSDNLITGNSRTLGNTILESNVTKNIQRKSPL